MAGAISITDYGVDNSDLTTYTFSGKSIGSAASDRYVLVGLGWREGTPLDRSLSSCKIGGNAATILRQDHVAAGGAAVIGLLVTSGTTADIELTFSAANSRVLIAVAAITGCDTSAAYAVNGLTGGVGTTSLAVNVNTPANGIAFGHMFMTDTAATPTLSFAGTDGLTGGTQQIGELNFFHARGGYSTTTAQTPRGVTASASGVGTSLGMAASIVSFSPASAGAIVGSGLTKGLKLNRLGLAA